MKDVTFMNLEFLQMPCMNDLRPHPKDLLGDYVPE